MVPGAHRQKEVLVVLSSPGDVVKERKQLDRVLQEVDAVFRGAGVTLRSWQYDVNAYPGAGADAQDALNCQFPETFDLFVAVLCQRLGTPTGRAISGTVEEYERARAAGCHTFLYFCSAVERRTDALSVKVREWRDSFRGLYGSFQSPADLAQQFKQDVLLWVVRNQLTGREAVTTPPQTDAQPEPAWLPALEREISDRSGSSDSARDVSIRWPRRVLSKLHVLFDLSSLAPAERDALVATASCLPLAPNHEPLNGVCFSEIATRLAWAPDFARAVQLSLQAGQSSSDFSVASPIDAGVRTDVVGALVRLGSMLDLDHDALGQKPGVDPSAHASLDDWRARLTRRVRVRRGMVRYELDAPSAEWEMPLRTCTAVALEATWQHVRSSLTAAGFSMAIAPSETILPAFRRPAPAEVLDQLRREADRIVQTFPLPPHLGETRVGSADHLLPLPDTTVAGDIRFCCGEGATYRLTVQAIVDGRDKVEICGGGPVLVLAYDRLQPGRRYRWQLVRVAAGLGDDLLAAAEFETLSEESRAIWRSAAALEPSVRGILGAELGLYDDTLETLWPRLEDASTEERLLVLRLLLDATRRAEQSMPGSTRVDAYRNAAHAVFQLATGRASS